MKHIDYWITHSLDKVFPDTKRPREARDEIQTICGGSEAEDVQLVLRPGKNVKIRKARIEFTALTGDDGVIPPSCLESWWIWYTWVQANPPYTKSPEDYIRKAPGFFPDAFLEEKELSIASEWTQSLWVRISVPHGTPAGVYHGELIVKLEYETGNSLAGLKPENIIRDEIRIPMACRVWSYSLPEENSLHHTNWFFHEHISDYYNLEPWSEKHWEWIEKAAIDLKKHHQDMILTQYFDLVDVILEDPSRPLESVRYDYGRLDRWISLFRKHGIPWIEGSHLAERRGGWMSDFAFIRFKACLSSGESLNLFDREHMNDRDYEVHLERFVRALYAHLEDHFGLERIVQHVADEPVFKNTGSWKNLAARTRSWIPGSVKIIDAALSPSMGRSIDHRVPQIHQIKASSRRNRETMEQGLWSYVCLSPQGDRPNRFLDQDSVRNRIICWLSYSLQLEGFLHWGYNFWGSWCFHPGEVRHSPWTDATGGSIYAHKREPLPAGDPFIVYPGKKGICSSIRWEVLRKGFEDHKLLTMLESMVHDEIDQSAQARRGRELLENVRSRHARDGRHYCKDGEELLALRKEIGEIVSSLYELQEDSHS